MDKKLLKKLDSDFPVSNSTDFQMIDIKAADYSSALPHVAEHLQKTFSKICVINSSREVSNLLAEFKKEKVDSKKILFLSGIKTNSNLANIKSFTPQWEINAVKQSISYAIKNFSPEVFVFDSVTFLSLFLRKEETTEFLEKFINILKERQIKAVFLNISNEIPEETAVAAEGLMDERILLEKFLGKKAVKKVKKPVKTPAIKPPAAKQEVNVKDLKKNLSQMIKEEAKKIAEETRKNLEMKEEGKPPFEKRQAAKNKKQEVHKLEKENEKRKLMKKLELLERSFELKVISEKALDEGKAQIKAKMKRL